MVGTCTLAQARYVSVLDLALSNEPALPHFYPHIPQIQIIMRSAVSNRPHSA